MCNWVFLLLHAMFPSLIWRMPSPAIYCLGKCCLLVHHSTWYHEEPSRQRAIGGSGCLQTKVAPNTSLCGPIKAFLIQILQNILEDATEEKRNSLWVASFIHSFFHSFIQSFIHSFIQSFIHSLIYSIFHSFNKHVLCLMICPLSI